MCHSSMCQRYSESSAAFSMHQLTSSCDHIYLGTLGRPHAANIVLAEAIRLAQIIALHDERLGEPIYNVVERETRRRVFWLLCKSSWTS
jgi:hypothetical protein